MVVHPSAADRLRRLGPPLAVVDRHRLSLVHLLHRVLLPARTAAGSPPRLARARRGARRVARAARRACAAHDLLRHLLLRGAAASRSPRLLELIGSTWWVALPASAVAVGFGAVSAFHRTQFEGCTAPLSICGIVAAIYCARRVEHLGWTRAIRFVGRNSLVFYVAHFPVILAAGFSCRMHSWSTWRSLRRCCSPSRSWPAGLSRSCSAPAALPPGRLALPRAEPVAAARARAVASRRWRWRAGESRSRSAWTMLARVD